MDNNISINKKEIIRKLEENEWQLEVYVITLSNNPHNQLEIYNSAILLQKSVDKKDILVVGITKGYNEALELVEKIMKEVYDNTKETDIKAYILKNQQNFEESNQ
jgi:hypothetical protein